MILTPFRVCDLSDQSELSTQSRDFLSANQKPVTSHASVYNQNESCADKNSFKRKVKLLISFASPAAEEDYL